MTAPPTDRSTSARCVLGCLVAAAAVAVLAAGCGGDRPAVPPTGAPGGAAPPRPGRTTGGTVGSIGPETVRATPIAAASTLPTGLVGTPDGRHLLVALVTGQVGVVDLRREGGLTVPAPRAQPWLDLSDRTKFDGENRGLLGIAMVDAGRRVAVSYTALDGAVTVETFPWSSGRQGDRRTGRVAFRAPHPLAGLSGGGIAALPDGDLVLGVGDMDDRFGRPPRAQDLGSPLGKLVRIGRAALRTGSAEPFTAAQVVARGLRNPWGVAADPATGDLWTGDVGDHLVEEIDRVPAGNPPGRVPDFGWPWLEGTRTGVPGRPAGLELTPPVVAERHRFEVCSVVGGVVYRGRQHPWLRGAYLFGDLCSSKIQAVLVRDGRVVQRRTLGTIGDKVLSFGTDRDGEVYVMAVNGTIARLDPASWRVPGRTDRLGPAAPPSPAGGPTTTIGTARPPARCGVVDVFAELEPASTLSPAQVRARLPRVRKLLDDAAATTTGVLHDDLVTYRRFVEEWISLGEAREWNFDDPELGSFFSRFGSGDGEFAGAPALIDRLIAGVADCPGQRL